MRAVLQAFCLFVILACLAVGPADLLPAAAQVSTHVIRVASGGSNTASCGSEGQPCQTIQYAVNLANSGDTILVAGSPGSGTTYTYDASTDSCTQWLGTTGIVCVLQKQLTILGGYSTADWSAAAPNINLTIIDGGHVHRGVMVLGYPTPSGTSLHMEGFTVQNGVARGISARGGDDAVNAHGGGMFADTVETIVLRNMVFRNNEAIGENTSWAYGGSAAGGGLVLRAVSNGTLEHITFESNQSRAGSGQARGGYGVGGGLGIDNSLVSGRYITLTGNVSIAGSTSGSGVDSTGQRADGHGGGASIGGDSSVTLQYVTAKDNMAIGGNAATYAGGAFGGALKIEKATCVLLDSDLRNNSAQGGNAVNGWLGNGGGLEAINSHVTIKRTYIVSNTAQGGSGTTGLKGAAGGGGINSTWDNDQYVAQLTVENSVIADNLATMGAGTSPMGGGGGGLWIQATDAEIVHSTIARNRIESGMGGAGILLIEVGTQGADADISYSIIAEHTTPSTEAALHVKPGNTATLYRDLFAGNARDTNASGVPGPAGTFIGLASVLTGTAGFVSPGSPNHDYHIKRGSSAINNATDSSMTTDVDGESRALFPPPDIGADEYVPIVLSVVPFANGALGLSWKTNTSLVTGIHHYNIVYSRDPGANLAQQGSSPINAGTATSFALTGLTDSKRYTFTVEARNSSNALIESSNTVVAIPLGNFVYLPITVK